MSTGKRKKASIKEAKVVLSIRKYFEKRYGKANIDWNKIHVSPLHNRGFPDIMVFTPGGVWVIEAKAPGKKPTLLQRAKLHKIFNAGCANVHWVDCDPADAKLLYFRSVIDDKIEFTSDANSNTY